MRFSVTTTSELHHVERAVELSERQRGVAPGRYRVVVSGLPPSHHIASATFNGIDAADHNLPLLTWYAAEPAVAAFALGIAYLVYKRVKDVRRNRQARSVSRAPSTGRSTVSTSADAPAEVARCTSSRVKPRSRCT